MAAADDETETPSGDDILDTDDGVDTTDYTVHDGDVRNEANDQSRSVGIPGASSDDDIVDTDDGVDTTDYTVHDEDVRG